MKKENILIRVMKKPSRILSRKMQMRRRRNTLVSQSSKPGVRIFYMLTPPPRLRNIGDHAQAVAILEWFKEKMPDRIIIELTKDDVRDHLGAISALMSSDDTIVLHSGGNLGDRGIWSEGLRRKIIESFPDNKIVSLPQTIYFHEHETGQRELATSKAIYNKHRNLTIVARDGRSHELAKNYFSRAKHLAAPDFVLRYAWRPLGHKDHNGRILLCLRQDDESALGVEDLERLRQKIELPYDEFDTTISDEIDILSRKHTLDRTLEMFSRYEAVITDRFHGLIFSILAGRPTLVLPTVDHKLTSAFDWFGSVEFVSFCGDMDALGTALNKIKNPPSYSVPNWDELYFDRIAREIS